MIIHRTLKHKEVASGPICAGPSKEIEGGGETNVIISLETVSNTDYQYCLVLNQDDIDFMQAALDTSKRYHAMKNTQPERAE